MFHFKKDDQRLFLKFIEAIKCFLEEENLDLINWGVLTFYGIIEAFLEFDDPLLITNLIIFAVAIKLIMTNKDFENTEHQEECNPVIKN